MCLMHAGRILLEVTFVTNAFKYECASRTLDERFHHLLNVCVAHATRIKALEKANLLIMTADLAPSRISNLWAYQISAIVGRSTTSLQYRDSHMFDQGNLHFYTKVGWSTTSLKYRGSCLDIDLKGLTFDQDNFDYWKASNCWPPLSISWDLGKIYGITVYSFLSNYLGASITDRMHGSYFAVRENRTSVPP